MKFILIISLMFSTLNVLAQSDTSTFTNDEIIDFPETQPEFPGGNQALFKYISTNIKYPPQSMENGIQGKVYISFVIEKNGEITNVKNLRGINSELDNEAIRVIKNMPHWKPGMQNGKAVRTRYTLPIMFKLSD